MGERFLGCRPLVPLPTISRKNARFENELVCIVDHLLGGLGRVAKVGVRDCVIDLAPDSLNGVGGLYALRKRLLFASQSALEMTV